MLPMGFDPLYLLLMLPGMALAGWAQARILSAYKEGSRYHASSRRHGGPGGGRGHGVGGRRRGSRSSRSPGN